MKRAGAALLLLLSSSLALAEEPKDDGWHFVLAPYAMGAKMDGTMALRGHDTEVDLSASKIRDHLEMGFLGLAVARKGNWGVLGDTLWVELGGTTQMPPADVDPTLSVVTVSGLRRINDWADVTLGGRWTHLNGDVTFKEPINMEVERSKQWIDPVVGVVLHTPGERRWHASLVADVGGFGIGSDLSWEVLPSVGFDLAKWASVEVGYKYLDTDYENGEGADRFAYDMVLEGPVAGVAFRF